MTRILNFCPGAALAAAFIIVATPLARADVIDPNDPIISIVPGGTCSAGGTNNLCNAGNPFSLKSLLSGNLGFLVANVSGAGSWVVTNDTGSALTSLTLFYSGTLDSNHFLDLQVNGWSASTVPFVNCQITQANSTVTNGCSNNTGSPVSLPATLNWSETPPGGSTADGFGIAAGATFDLMVASFDTSHQDVGCISGTSTCTPTVPTPEPTSLALLGSALAGLGLFARPRRRRG